MSDTDADLAPEAGTRLHEEFVDRFSPEIIDEILRDSTVDLAAHAKVHNFVPMLAERRTRERLEALAHA